MFQTLSSSPSPMKVWGKGPGPPECFEGSGFDSIRALGFERIAFSMAFAHISPRQKLDSTEGAQPNLSFLHWTYLAVLGREFRASKALESHAECFRRLVEVFSKAGLLTPLTNRNEAVQFSTIPKPSSCP